MNMIAQFQLIGRIGEVREVGTTLRVSVASAYSWRNEAGEWENRTRWNEVTIFNDATKAYVRRNLGKGDLIYVSGTLAQAKWQKDGQTVYGVTLTTDQIDLLARGPNRDATGANGGADASGTDRDGDRDIPF